MRVLCEPLVHEHLRTAEGMVATYRRDTMFTQQCYKQCSCRMHSMWTDSFIHSAGHKHVPMRAVPTGAYCTTSSRAYATIGVALYAVAALCCTHSRRQSGNNATVKGRRSPQRLLSKDRPAARRWLRHSRRGCRHTSSHAGRAGSSTSPDDAVM